MAKKRDPINPTDDQAREMARQLVTSSPVGALGVKEPATGVPLVSRVACAHSGDSGLFFLASDLSNHATCLSADAACSIMLGEPGKGDPLAHPRITIIGQATRLANNDPRRAGLREAFLAVHPKAALYIDFADFGFYPVVIKRALLNGGFGKAYRLQAGDFGPV